MICIYQQAAEKAAQQTEGDTADGEISFEIEVPKEKEEDGVGIPNIMVDCADKSVSPFDKVLDTNRLPTMEEVTKYLLYNRENFPCGKIKPIRLYEENRRNIVKITPT